MDTTRDIHFHSVQTGHSCLKIKFNKLTSKTKACNTDFTFGPSDSVTFFIDQSQQSDKGDNCEESFFEEKQSRDESFRVNNNDYLSDDSVLNSEDEGDIELLNYSEDPIKSSKLIVFWSCLVTLFNFCFQCPRKAHISKLRTQGLAVLVNITRENGHENQWCSQPKLSKARAGNILLASAVLFSENTFSRINEMIKIANTSFFSHTLYLRYQKALLFPAINHIYKQ